MRGAQQSRDRLDEKRNCDPGQPRAPVEDVGREDRPPECDEPPHDDAGDGGGEGFQDILRFYESEYWKTRKQWRGWIAGGGIASAQKLVDAYFDEVFKLVFDDQGQAGLSQSAEVLSLGLYTPSGSAAAPLHRVHHELDRSAGAGPPLRGSRTLQEPRFTLVAILTLALRVVTIDGRRRSE